MIIISDIHGCYYTLLRLLAKCPKDQVVFCGDLVDRGPHSRQVIEYAINNKIPTVMGNHEHMMLDYLDKNGNYADGTFQGNGGNVTLQSFGGYIPVSVRLWLRTLPFHLEFGELLISHTGHGKNPHQLSALWCRETTFPSDGLFRVFGHTPQKDALIADTYSNIDTGAAYGHYGLGKMTALQWPDMKVFEQEYNETPIP